MRDDGVMDRGEIFWVRAKKYITTGEGEQVSFGHRFMIEVGALVHDVAAARDGITRYGRITGRDIVSMLHTVSWLERDETGDQRPPWERPPGERR